MAFKLMTPSEDLGPLPRSRRPSRGLSVVEALGLGVVLVVLTVITVHLLQVDPVSKALRARYGPSKVTEWQEEWIIRDFFRDRREGIFLDVGAQHYREGSNTYFLETQLGWSGIAVDAMLEYGPDYAVHRPRTRYVAMFAADLDNITVPFFVSPNVLVSSADQDFARARGGVSEMRQVPTAKLTTLLDQWGITKIDFMSMDIELAEPKALAGLDIERFRPDLVCIEGHLEVRQQILDYFARHGYVVIGKYLRADEHNLYFMPIG